jgi:decaprenylphospho-beta-D-erythro-pentofuranosid-2-ulose 2-reductase
MNIVVIGATSAVAQAAIRIWASAQHSLILFGRNAAELERIAADARVRGAIEVTVHAGDITAVGYIQSAVAALPITPVTSTASIASIALIAHGSNSDSDRADRDANYLHDEINVNFTSAALWAQLLANSMVPRGEGSVAVISSVAGDRGRYSNHAYGAAKAGLSAFCSGLRARMSHHGVNVITIKPGFIDTPMTAHVAKKGALWATPEQIARGIVRAIEKKRSIVYLPGFWRLIMLVIQHVPEAIFKKMKF